MLTWEKNVETAVLRKQGWTISAIARHLGHDRKTIRAYLNGDRVPGQRASTRVDPFEEFAEYARIRLADDPHLLAESEDQPHLIEALDGVVRRLGGCTKAWRFDRAPSGVPALPLHRHRHRGEHGRRLLAGAWHGGRRHGHSRSPPPTG